MYYILGIIVALIAPLATGRYGHFLLANILVYTLVAMSLRILVGFAGHISIGHAGFWALGAYTSAIMVVKLGTPFILGVVCGGIVAGVFGLIVSLPALRVSGHYLAIATLGFALSIQQVLFEWESLTGGRHGLFVPRPQIAGVLLNTDFAYYYLMLPLVMLLGWVAENLRKSHTGYALMALKMSKVAAQTAGVGRARHLFVAFTVSAFYTGVSGAFYAPLIGYLSTEAFSLGLSLAFLTMAVIGGLGSFVGPILGAIYLTIAPEVLRELKSAQMVIYGVTLVLCMWFLPGGLVTIPKRILGLWKNKST